VTIDLLCTRLEEGGIAAGLAAVHSRTPAIARMAADHPAPARHHFGRLLMGARTGSRPKLPSRHP
jgi:hypothetical protein